MTQERQDGWYWIQATAQDNGRWQVAMKRGNHFYYLNYADANPYKVSERIPAPDDEPKDPDLLAVVAAAKECVSAMDAPYDWKNPFDWDRLEKAKAALRSALAKLEERGS